MVDCSDRVRIPAQEAGYLDLILVPSNLEGDCLDPLRINHRPEEGYLDRPRVNHRLEEVCLDQFRINNSLEGCLDQIRINRSPADCLDQHSKANRLVAVRQPHRSLRGACLGSLSNRAEGYSVAQIRNSNNPNSRLGYSVVLAPVHSNHSSSSSSNAN